MNPGLLKHNYSWTVSNVHLGWAGFSRHQCWLLFHGGATLLQEELNHFFASSDVSSKLLQTCPPGNDRMQQTWCFSSHLQTLLTPVCLHFFMLHLGCPYGTTLQHIGQNHLNLVLSKLWVLVWCEGATLFRSPVLASVHSPPICCQLPVAHVYFWGYNDRSSISSAAPRKWSPLDGNFFAFQLGPVLADVGGSGSWWDMECLVTTALQHRLSPPGSLKRHPHQCRPVYPSIQECRHPQMTPWQYPKYLQK